MKAFTINPDSIIIALWGLATITTFFAILFDNSNIGVSISAFTIALALWISVYLNVLKSDEDPITTRFVVFATIAFPIGAFILFSVIAGVIIEIISFFNYSGQHFVQASIVTFFTCAVTAFFMNGMRLKNPRKTNF